MWLIHKKFLMIILLLCFAWSELANAEIKNMPRDFVYLKDVDPSIIQDIRYTTTHNFMGHPIVGYQAPQCILTRRTAEQLKKIQLTIKPLGYSLKVYDCYRPQRSVNAFIVWINNPTQTTKAEFFPEVNAKNLHKQVHLGKKSEHSRGSTVDLTIVKLPVKQQERYNLNQLSPCYAPYKKRFRDNSVDMGTGFDCFISPLSRPTNVNIPVNAYLNRMFLRYWMEKYGFTPAGEWWHFTLRNEPYPNTYFDFPIR